MRPGQRETAGLAHGGHADHLHRHVELPRHGTDQGELLPVLLAEERLVGRDDVEELRDHRGDTVEVPRAAGAAQGIGQGRQGDRDLPVASLRIHLVDGGREEVVRADLAKVSKIVVECARVVAEVLVRAELGGIDEDGHHGDVAGLATCTHQREVSFVEIAHRGHQTDGAVGGAKSVAQRRDVLGDHRGHLGEIGVM